VEQSHKKPSLRVALVPPARVSGLRQRSLNERKILTEDIYTRAGGTKMYHSQQEVGTVVESGIQS